MFDGLNHKVDIFVRYLPFDELVSAAQTMCVKDSMVCVASFQHVIGAKQITYRQNDLQDIEVLLNDKS